MFKIKTKRILLTVLACLLFASSASAEYFSDVILTGTAGIWVDSRSYASLQHAVTAVGGAEREIVIIGDQAATALTIPANVRLKFLRDGSINNTGQLTVNTRSITAGDRQIFTGTGDIDFIDGSVVRSPWFSDIVEALDVTLDDTLTMIISETGHITSNSAVGNNVTLKWESSDNRLIVYGGRVLSNVKNIIAGNYQIFAGAGDIDFLDGSELYLVWFRRLRSVLTWVENEEVTIIVNEDSTVDYTQASAANENIRIIPGGVLTLPAGITLTLNGPVEAAPDSFSLNATATLAIDGPFGCGLYQVFSATGTVSFGSDGRVNGLSPEWWGAVADGTVNCKVAIEAAVASATAHIHPILLQPGTYSVGAGLVIDKQISFIGLGHTFYSATIQAVSGGSPVIDFTRVPGVSYCRLRNLQVKAHAASTCCVRYSGTDNGAGMDTVRLDANGCPTCLILLNGTWFRMYDTYTTGATDYNIQNGTAACHGVERLWIDSGLHNVATNGFVKYEDVGVSWDLFIQNTHVEECAGKCLVGIDGTNAPADTVLRNILEVVGAFETIFRRITTGVCPSFTIDDFSGADPTYLFKDDIDASNDIPFVHWLHANSIVLKNRSFCQMDTQWNDQYFGFYHRDGAGDYQPVYIWLDTVGTMRVNTSVPAGATDGMIIGPQGALAFLDNSGTPTVQGEEYLRTGGVVAITDFDDGVEGQVIIVAAEHNITITDGTNIFLNGSANFVMAVSDTLTLICKADGFWYETGRSDN